MTHDEANPIDRPLEDARDELRELVEALGAHVERRRRSGQRHTPLPPDVSSPAAAAPPARSASVPVERPVERPVEHPVAHSTAGLPQPLVRRGAAPPPPPMIAARSAQSRLAEIAGQSAANREIAAACGDLESLRAAVAACRACDLCRTRQQTVFADGDGSTGVMFVGEAPGADEDAQGVPFVGKAGQLLTDIIEKGMGVPRSKVAIANVLKCRPPGNRDPTEAETALCTPFLDRQMELLAPRVVIPLGRHAANHVLGFAGAARLSMGAMRGKVFQRAGRTVVATYHPSYLLRSPSEKKECWKDIQIAMRELGLEPPQRPGRTA